MCLSASSSQAVACAVQSEVPWPPRVLLEHVRHVCPPELEIELLVLAPEGLVAA
jgi:hypothetical protein